VSEHLRCDLCGSTVKGRETQHLRVALGPHVVQISIPYMDELKGRPIDEVVRWRKHFCNHCIKKIVAEGRFEQGVVLRNLA
jgi:hypothetical protein